MQVYAASMQEPYRGSRRKRVLTFSEMVDEYRSCFSFDDAMSSYDTFMLQGAVPDVALKALHHVSIERGWQRIVELEE